MLCLCFHAMLTKSRQKRKRLDPNAKCHRFYLWNDRSWPKYQNNEKRKRKKGAHSFPVKWKNLLMNWSHAPTRCVLLRIYSFTWGTRNDQRLSSLDQCFRQCSLSYLVWALLRRRFPAMTWGTGLSDVVSLSATRAWTVPRRCDSFPLSSLEWTFVFHYLEAPPMKKLCFQNVVFVHQNVYL